MKRHLSNLGAFYAIKTGIEQYYHYNGSPIKNSQRLEDINQIIEDAVNDKDAFFEVFCHTDKETGEMGKPDTVYQSGVMTSDRYSALDVEFEAKAQAWRENLNEVRKQKIQ